ncbi:transposase [Brenneria izadpanahii]|uniref:Transposase n=1 Tax=Brenneria izadpanahii TaxID=2722756 RepID=A0ABX7UTT9_9GAMM|nr:transposase [Brenneria izadpanahii]QTF08710.1 transposase [Brenneria izadpanahii]
MKQRRSINGNLEDSIHNVSLSKLDLKLSEWVDKARKIQPVMVKRYGVPWVWLVAHPLWVEMDHLSSFIPPSHALVDLREAIDDVMAGEHDAVSKLGEKCICGVNARTVIRAWLLQILYSRTSARQVYEILTYNMLWRWFIGYDRISEKLPKAEPFIHDMDMVSTDPGALGIVCRCLANHEALHDNTGEFCINHGLLHTLRIRHPARKPSDAEDIFHSNDAEKT